MQQALRAQASRAPQEGSAFVFWTQQGGWAGNHISVLRLMERPNEDSARATLIGRIALDNLSARTILVRGTDELVWVIAFFSAWNPEFGCKKSFLRFLRELPHRGPSPVVGFRSLQFVEDLCVGNSYPCPYI